MSDNSKIASICDFSIIIPCYNTAKFVGYCIESVITQDYPMENVEIIVVNDCSPDNLKDIVFEYQSKYPNIIYLENYKNLRQGGARNAGLRVAKGTYVMFLDSDDAYACKGTLTYFANLMKYSGLNAIESSSFCSNISILPKYEDKLEIRSNIQRMKQLDFFLAVWDTCFRRDFLIEHNMYFAENVSFEDADWKLKFFMECPLIGYVNFPFYWYRTNEESTTHSRDKRIFVDKIKAVKRSIDIVSKGNYSPELTELLLEFVKKIICAFSRTSNLFTVKDTLSSFSYMRRSGILDKKFPNMTLAQRFTINGYKYYPLLVIFPHRFKKFLRKILCFLKLYK